MGMWSPTQILVTRSAIMSSERRGTGAKVDGEAWETRRDSSLGGLRWLRRGNAHFNECCLATSTDVLPDAVVADFRHEVPATSTLVAGRRVDLNDEIRALDDVDGGDIDRFFEARGVES